MIGRQESSWRERYKQNTQWFLDQTEKYGSEAEIRMIVIFAHVGNPNPVFRTIQRYSIRTRTPILYINGNGHFFKIGQHKKYFVRLQVDRGGIAQPLYVTVGGTSPNLVSSTDYEFFSGLVRIERKWKL